MLAGFQECGQVVYLRRGYFLCRPHEAIVHVYRGGLGAFQVHQYAFLLPRCRNLHGLLIPGAPHVGEEPRQMGGFVFPCQRVSFSVGVCRAGQHDAVVENIVGFYGGVRVEHQPPCSAQWQVFAVVFL